MKKSLIACVLAFSSFSLVAHAQPGDGWATIGYLDVSYGDLNLSNPMGAEVMLSRIKFAATRVCGGLPDIRELRERMNFKKCVRVATEDAVGQVDAPLLTALYNEHNATDTRFAYGAAAR